jgi:hypothetical protein
MRSNVVIVLTLSVTLLVIPAAVGQSVNGRNATFVSYGSIDKELGFFIQGHGFTWREVGDNWNRRTDFNETGRDDWSIYLHDSSRNVSIQLDLYLKRIFRIDELGKRQELNGVRETSSKVNGLLVSRVGYSDGSGRVIGELDSQTRGQWVDRSLLNGKVKHRFREVNRDEWSVYLQEKSKNVAIQIDLYTRMVTSSQISGSDRHQIYRVEEAQ